MLTARLPGQSAAVAAAAADLCRSVKMARAPDDGQLTEFTSWGRIACCMARRSDGLWSVYERVADVESPSRFITVQRFISLIIHKASSSPCRRIISPLSPTHRTCHYDVMPPVPVLEAGWLQQWIQVSNATSACSVHCTKSSLFDVSTLYYIGLSVSQWVMSCQHTGRLWTE